MPFREDFGLFALFKAIFPVNYRERSKKWILSLTGTEYPYTCVKQKRQGCFLLLWSETCNHDLRLLDNGRKHAGKE